MEDRKRIAEAIADIDAALTAPEADYDDNERAEIAALLKQLRARLALETEQQEEEHDGHVLG